MHNSKTDSNVHSLRTAMGYLPNIEYITMAPSVHFHTDVNEDYLRFEQYLQTILIQGFSAIVVNNSELINAYINVSAKDRILEVMLLRELINQPSLLLGDLNKDSNATFYLNGNAPTFITIVYYEKSKTIDVSYYKSTEYIRLYE